MYSFVGASTLRHCSNIEQWESYQVQVKYAALQDNGTIEVKFRTSWADKHGTHIRYYNENDFDLYAIYCPEREIVLYVPNTKKTPRVIRFEKTRNNQGKYVSWADDYRVIK